MHIRAGIALFIVTLFFTMPAPELAVAPAAPPGPTPPVVVASEAAWTPAPAELSPLFSAEPFDQADVPLSFGSYRPT